LTLKFHAAVERAFESSSQFNYVAEGPPGTLRVYITNHVEPRRWLWWTRFVYTVEFTTTQDERGLPVPLDSPSRRVLGTSKQTCWQRSVDRCAADVVKDAWNAAKKMAPYK